jgi:lysophospholipase L1-like esterase
MSTQQRRIPSTRRKIVFKILACFLGLICAGLLAEGLARIYFAGDRHGYKSLRARLANEVAPESQFQRCIGQPYLLYVPTPGHREGSNFHNEQGYRGKAVPMTRIDNVARVLCLGGSTTYGNGTQDANTTYPAQLEDILRSQLPPSVKDVEVINGGLPLGTTAELLTHYHFKFHYFRPDLVIINTGGNDACVLTNHDYYQPDYSHWCSPLQPPQPLSPLGRTLLKSRLASLIFIQLLYGRDPGNSWLIRPEDLPPPTVWHPAAREPGLGRTLPDSDLAFTHNLKTLLTEVSNDGVKILLVPFRLAPDYKRYDNLQPEFLEAFRNERILKQIASEQRLSVAPFPADLIPQKNWVDDCHLDADGCRRKAQHIAKYARKLLWPPE